MVAALSGTAALFPQLATTLGITADVHGSLLALARAGAVLAFIGLHYTAFWRQQLWPLWVAQAVAAGAITLFAISDRPGSLRGRSW